VKKLPSRLGDLIGGPNNNDAFWINDLSVQHMDRFDDPKLKKPERVAEVIWVP
jgi:hypothetical protein